MGYKVFGGMSRGIITKFNCKCTWMYTVYACIHVLCIGDAMTVVVLPGGAVQVFVNQTSWLYICPNDHWTDTAADVVCREVGYDFGVVSTAIWCVSHGTCTKVNM